jgi:hypothetical protein
MSNKEVIKELILGGLFLAMGVLAGYITYLMLYYYK